MRSIYFKELSIYFSSPLFYVIAAVFACISGIYFCNAMAYVSLLSATIAHYQAFHGISMDNVLVQPIFSDLSMLVVFLTPLISMRLYAEERAEGTIELLFTYPVSDLKVLLGKYLSGLTILTIMLFLTLPLMGIMAVVTRPNWGLVASSYLGLTLLAGAILSMGLFFSSLTKNQIVAASFTIGLILVFWSIGWFSAVFPDGTAGTLLRELSFVNHISPFLKGSVSLKDIVFFIEFSLFFLVLTFEVIESNRWKG